jgi:hypothetical protein
VIGIAPRSSERKADIEKHSGKGIENGHLPGLVHEELRVTAYNVHAVHVDKPCTKIVYKL